MRFLCVLGAIACAAVAGKTGGSDPFSCLWFLFLALLNTAAAIEQHRIYVERSRA